VSRSDDVEEKCSSESFFSSLLKRMKGGNRKFAADAKSKFNKEVAEISCATASI